ANVFEPGGVYAIYPSVTPLRFGVPYLIILVAVLAARRERHARAGRYAMLALIALAAAWSFETWAYSAATFGLIAVVDAVGEGRAAVRVIALRAAQGMAASVLGIALVSLL